MKLLSFNNNSNCYIALFSHLHKLTALPKLNATKHKKKNDTTTATTAAAAAAISSGLILYGASLFAEQKLCAVTVTS